MMKDIFGKEINFGDLMIEATGSFMLTAIYKGRGQAHSVQYYSVTQWVADNLVERGLKARVQYSNAYYKNRYMKIDESMLDEETLDIYSKMKAVLFNVINNTSTKS